MGAESLNQLYSMLPLSLALHDLLEESIMLACNEDIEPCAPELTILLIVLRIMRPAKPRAETKVGKFDVTFLIDQYVIRFNVPDGEE